MPAHPIHARNHPAPIPDTTKPFTVSTPPATDIWRKPPQTDTLNAPILYTPTTVSDFRSALTTLTLPATHQYDQAGLCLIISATSSSPRWLKTGIEYHHGKPQISTVVTETWSDWSLRPSPNDSLTATMEIVADDDGSLKVYLVAGSGIRSLLREVTWWADLPGDTECLVGVYAARPDPEREARGKEVVVEFQELEVVTKSGKQPSVMPRELLKATIVPKPKSMAKDDAAVKVVTAREKTPSVMVFDSSIAPEPFLDSVLLDRVKERQEAERLAG